HFFVDYIDDGVPVWEKEFCYAVGAVPWHKVVDAKKFSYSQSQILKWDDSAGKEAFHNAKNRYWAVINGLSCDIPPPDPDACIDEINWNPYIDPELIRELEQEYYAPVDDEEMNFGNMKKKTKNMFSDPLEGCSMNPAEDVGNRWETQNFVLGSSAAVTAGCQGWGDQWDDNLKESNDSNKDDNNPWEKARHQGDEAVDGSGGWPVVGDDSWGWNTSSGTLNERGWRNNSSSQAWARKPWDEDAAEETQKSNYRKPNVGGWRTWNKDSWRNEGGNQHGTGYSRTIPRFDGNYDYRAGGHHWRGKKRANFGYN
ncbi:unnamed protein product, partial [Linum tenue]